jgi:hypothetical protein
MNEVNALLPNSVIRMPDVSVAQVDSDYDSINDNIYLNVSTPLRSGETVQSVTLMLFYKASFKDRVKTTMTGMTTIQHSSIYPGSLMTVNADLGVSFLNPIPTSTRTVYNVPVVVPGNLTSISQILPATILSSYALRNETISLNHRVPIVWTPGELDSFKIQLNLRIPTQVVPYIPAVAQVLKGAWIQYLAFLWLMYFIVYYIRQYVFRYQVVPTKTTLDTTPAIKLHQY